MVYLPVLDNAVKASKLRSTLGVFEKSKFLFNLPGQLLESINAGKYDQALRDYKKGLFLHRGGALMPGVKATTPDQIARQRRIFNKVWDSVEDVMRDLRRRLYVLLKDPSRSIEEQEKTLEMLIEIEGSDEPAWSFLDFQHDHILDSVKSIYERGDEAVKRAMREAAAEPSSSSPYTDLLRRQLAQPQYAPNTVTRKLQRWPLQLTSATATEKAWSAIQKLLKQLSDYIARSLPGFWRVAKACLDGKYRKRDSSGALRASHRPASACRQMAADIIKAYIVTLAQFFALSDVGVSSKKRLRDQTVPAFVPAGTTVIAAGYYGEQVANAVADCTSELLAIDVSKEVSSSVKTFMESLRWRMEEMITTTWIRDASELYLLEDWKPPVNEGILRGRTRFIYTMDDFQARVIKAARATATGTAPGSDSKAAVPPLFQRKIREGIVESQTLLFEGIMRLAQLTDAEAHAVRASGTKDKTPTTDQETRLLYTLSAFHYERKKAVPAIMSLAAKLLGPDAAADETQLEDARGRLELQVFDACVSLRAEPMCAIVTDAMLHSGIDWLTCPAPTEVRGYMHRLVLQLVEAHARASSVNAILVNKLLQALVTRVAQAALDAFRTIKRFGTGGMLTATVEIEYLQQSVEAYLSRGAKEAFGQTYEVISRGLRSNESPEALQRELASLQTIIRDTRRVTAIETIALRPATSRNDSTTRR